MMNRIINDMKDSELINKDEDNGLSKNKSEEKMFTKPVRDGKIEYIEREVDRFNFDGFEVVRREWFSKANCPAITFKYGSVVLNVRAIRKLGKCSHILFLMNPEQKLLIVKPCKEDDKDSQQCSRVGKRGEVVPRMINCKGFTTKLYQNMKWRSDGTYKMLGTLFNIKDTNEKLFAFELINAEAYLRIAEPSADDPKRRIRVQMPEPEHWKENFGQSYEEYQNPIVKTFEGIPEGFVKITIPQFPFEKPMGASDEVESNKNEKETTEDGVK